MARNSILINGKWQCGASKQTLPVTSPSTSEIIAEVANANSKDVNLAVESANKAFNIWKECNVYQRGKILKQCSSLIRERIEDLAIIAAKDNGSPIRYMRGYAERAAEWFDYFGSLASELKGSSIPTTNNTLAYTTREHYGVVAQLIPWNAPYVLFASHVAPALVAGNTVVIKLSELAPLCELMLGQLLNELLPPGTLNIITGQGEIAGKALVKHPLVKKISFTGSFSAGKTVMELAAAHITPMQMELGGNNPSIVFPDAQIPKAVQGIISGMCLHLQGQSCFACNRLFLHEEIYDQFLKSLQEKLSSIIVGLPDNEKTEMGALISKERLQDVLSYIESANKEGARVIMGGKRPSSNTMSKGNFLLPTVLTDVKSTMKITQKSCFGPVLCVFRWKDYEKMLSEVNDVSHGLSASIWTQNLETSHKTARKLISGYIWINQAAKVYTGVPFGGMRDSGFGRQICLDGLLNYTQEKSIIINL